MRQFNRVLTGTVCGSIACSIISSNIVSGADVGKISWFNDKKEIFIEGTKRYLDSHITEACILIDNNKK